MGKITDTLFPLLMLKSYGEVARERALFEHLLKNYDQAVREKLINRVKVSRKELEQMCFAYRDAIWKKEREIMKKVFLRGRR